MPGPPNPDLPPDCGCCPDEECECGDCQRCEWAPPEPLPFGAGRPQG